MNVGFSQIGITPPVGMLMAGQPVNYYAKGVESPLFATAVCLRQGDVSVVIVSCDLLVISNEMASALRNRAQGISAENSIICTTHTHSGPMTQALFGMDADAAYINQLQSNILLAIKTADCQSYCSGQLGHCYTAMRTFCGMVFGNIRKFPF